MVFGIPPFYDEDLEVMKHNILTQQLFIPKDKTISKQCCDLMFRLLEKNPKKRIGISYSVKKVHLLE